VRSWFKPDETYDRFLREEPKNAPKKADLEAMYQRCFNTEDGFRVLLHLLSQLGFFRETETQQDVILANFAKKLLRNLGCWESGKGASLLQNILRVYKET
jgi:hypothetical protein